MLQFMNEFLSIGPPVYFVVSGKLNYSDTKIQNMICGGQNCNYDSLTAQIYRANKQANRYGYAIYYCKSTYYSLFG